MKHTPFMMKASLLIVASALCSIASSSAQFTTLVGFEGANPFASPTVTTPPVTLRTAGDFGASDVGSFGVIAPQGSRYAVLSTFSDGNGTYPPGAPIFGGAGAVTAPTLWASMFPGSANNQLPGLGIVTGSTITFVLNLAVGNIVSFNYLYLTSEVLGGNVDRAFVGVRLGNSGDPQTFQTLSQPNAGMVASPSAFFDLQDSAVGTFSFTATSAGVYTFGVGVGDGGSEGTQSGLLVDNFSINPIPEPGTVSLLLGAGLGVLLLRRRFAKSAAADKA